MPNPGSRGVLTGQQGSPGGRAAGIYMEICEADALVVKLIEGGGFNPGISVGSDVAIALVVGEDEDDVWGLGGAG